MRRKSFFSSTSGTLFICSAVYGVVRGASSTGGEGLFLLPCAGGRERLHSLISFLLFHLFCARMSSRWASVVRPHTRRKSTFFEGRESLVPLLSGGRQHFNILHLMTAQVRMTSAGLRTVFRHLGRCVQFKWGLFHYSSQMGLHLLFIAFII